MSISRKAPPMKRRLPRFCAGWKTTFRTIDWSRPDIGWCMAGHFIPRRFCIDASVTAELRRLIPLAPLHQPHNLAAIAALSKLHPTLPQIACFDTAFHHTQSEVATAFALPRRLTAEGVRRYGFHGLSYEYIASVLPDILGPRSRRRSRCRRPSRQRRQHVCDASSARAWQRPWASPLSMASQ